MKKSIYFYLIIFFLLIFFGNFYNVFSKTNNKPKKPEYYGHKGNYRFIKNEGQWHKNVIFRSSLPSGDMFLENTTFTYLLYDSRARHFDHFHDNNGRNRSNTRTKKKKKKNNKIFNQDIPDKVQHHAFKMKIKNASPEKIYGKHVLPTNYNYYLGKDRSKWVSGAKGYKKVIYKSIYDNIDATVYSKNNHLKYDFIVSKNTDPSKIKLLYRGLNKLNIKEGNLILHTALGNIIEKKPYAYQIINGQKVKVPCKFKCNNNNVTFHFPDGYNKNYKLIIDPELIFSTFSGSNSNNFGYTATFDNRGFLYSGSTAFGNNYPTTLGAYERSFSGGNTDIALTKYDTSGTFMVYSTYLGGSEDELPHSLITNDDQELYVFGTTSSLDFPVSFNAYNTSFNGGTVFKKKPSYPYGSLSPNSLFGLGVNYQNGSDIIISKLGDKGGVLEASTYIGGSGNDGLNSVAPNHRPTENYLRYNYADEVRGEIDIDPDNVIFLATCTRSKDFPIVGNTFQQNYGGGSLDGVMLKIDKNLENIIWSSYLGGNDDDAIYSLSIDKNADLYVAGGTRSSDFPVSDSAIYNNYQGGRADGFITHIRQGGDTILNSTFYGSNEYDQIYFIEMDNKDSIHIYGQTEIMDSTFIQNVNFAQENSGQFLSKLSPSLDTIEWSTVFGNKSGRPSISPTAFLVDLCNKIYISGWGGETNQEDYLFNNAGYTYNFTTTPDAFQSTTDGSDFYLMVLEDDASGIFYSTYMGGPKAAEHVDGGTSRFDTKGKIYQSVCAGCNYPKGYSDFPIKPDDAVSPQNNSNCNNAVFKFDFLIPSVVADFRKPDVVCKKPYQIDFKNFSKEYKESEYMWFFGDGDSTTLKEPVHTYNQAGTYDVKLFIIDSTSCNLIDSTTKTVKIIKDTSYSLSPQNLCKKDSMRIGFDQPLNKDFTYTWNPSSKMEGVNTKNPLIYPDKNTNYTVTLEGEYCTYKATQSIEVKETNISVSDDTIYCSNDPPMILKASSPKPADYIWSPQRDFSTKINKGNNSSITIEPLQAKNTYYAKAIDQTYGCEGIDSVNVFVSDIATDITKDQYICARDSVTLKVTTNNNIDSLTYNWRPNKYIVSENNNELVVRPDSTITYLAFGKNQENCSYNETSEIKVSPVRKGSINAFADTNKIFERLSTTLHVRPKGLNYEWTPVNTLSDPQSTDPKASPLKKTTYKVTASDPKLARCEAVDTVTIDVEDVICGPPNLFIPNAFSPNGDGKNDKLFIRGRFIKEMHLVIYNRWGEKVFETHRQDKGWDGTFRGREMDPGVYDYYLEVTCIGNKNWFKKGNITLIR